MSLRVRLITLIVLVLLVSLCVGGLVAVLWHAVRSVRTELQAALAVGAQTLRNGIDELADKRLILQADLGRLVHMFDGDRHLRAVLSDPGGRATRRPPA